MQVLHTYVLYLYGMYACMYINIPYMYIFLFNLLSNTENIIFENYSIFFFKKFVQGPPNTFFWKMLLKKTSKFFSNFFLFESTILPVNNEK